MKPFSSRNELSVGIKSGLLRSTSKFGPGTAPCWVEAVVFNLKPEMRTSTSSIGILTGEGSSPHVAAAT
jgi:hypothetical protein